MKSIKLYLESCVLEKKENKEIANLVISRQTWQ